MCFIFRDRAGLHFHGIHLHFHFMQLHSLTPGSSPAYHSPYMHFARLLLLSPGGGAGPWYGPFYVSKAPENFFNMMKFFSFKLLVFMKKMGLVFFITSLPLCGGCWGVPGLGVMGTLRFFKQAPRFDGSYLAPVFPLPSSTTLTSGGQRAAAPYAPAPTRHSPSPQARRRGLRWCL